MTQPGSPSGAQPPGGDRSPGGVDEEHFKPVGTVFLLVIFVAALILLWASVYVILISRGVTT
jgi:hypothetical protein